MKKLLVLLGLLVCLGILTGCQEALKSYNTGLTAFEEERYKDAVSAFKLAISQGQKGGAVHADLALAYLRAEDTENAEKSLNDALALSPEDPDVLKKAGIYYQYSGDLKTALSYFQQSVTTDIHAMSRRDLETCAYAAGIEKEFDNLEEAIRIYNILIESGYYSKEHEIMVGECYLEMHQIDAATQYFDMLTLHKEATAYDYLRVYKDLYEAGAYSKAERFFESGVKTTEQEGSPVTKAEYYAIAGKYEIANTFFKTETSVSGLLAKARTLQEFGEYEEAEEIFTEILSRDLGSAEVYNQYMMLKMRRKQYTEAAQLLTQIKAYKDDAVLKKALWNEVVMYEMIEDFETAYDKLVAYMKSYQTNEQIKREYRFLSRVKAG